MQTTDTNTKTPLLNTVPTELVDEIRRMRRNPDHFFLRRRISCSLGCDRKGERSAYQLSHDSAEEVASWCPTHGFLYFDSVGLPPTERLLPSEIEANRLEQQRKRGPRRKAA